MLVPSHICHLYSSLAHFSMCLLFIIIFFSSRLYRSIRLVVVLRQPNSVWHDTHINTVRFFSSAIITISWFSLSFIFAHFNGICMWIKCRKSNWCSPSAKATYFTSSSKPWKNLIVCVIFQCVSSTHHFFSFITIRRSGLFWQ